MNITNLHELNNTLSHGPYAWPGGYSKYFVMQDGETCCFECINDNRVEVYAAEPVPTSPDPQWWPIAVDINWEDPSLYCAHCNKPIESAYVPHETEEEA